MENSHKSRLSRYYRSIANKGGKPFSLESCPQSIAKVHAFHPDCLLLRQTTGVPTERQVPLTSSIQYVVPFKEDGATAYAALLPDWR